MKKFWFERAYVDGDWKEKVEISVDDTGTITELSFDSPSTDGAERISGFVIPALANVHSHAFQWSFAGQSEFRTRDNDSFWSWREQMYASLAGLDPDSCEQTATQLYRLMMQHGYSTVGEFHYVHNDGNGEPYPDPTALATAHINAAVKTGIRICLIPVLYQRGGFDDSPLGDAQRRFELSDEQFIELIGRLHSEWSQHPLVSVGMAFHSLRAVDPAKFKDVISRVDAITGGRPIHIHVAEQLKEVDDCVSATGRRPVELLFDHADVNERWCLIHATHMSEKEIAMVANSGAVVGLCPTTEANLGDGIFSAEEFVNLGGRFAIGSDSHVSVCPFSELRMLEYGQRLTKHRRAVLCSVDESCGRFLFRKALEGGVQAMGQGSAPGIVRGGPADLVVLNSHPAVDDVPIEHLLSRLMFGQFGNSVGKVMIAGEWTV